MAKTRGSDKNELAELKLPRIENQVDHEDMTPFELNLFNQTYMAAIVSINAHWGVTEARKKQLMFASLIQSAIFLATMAVKVHRDMMTTDQLEQGNA
jgi:hypothetical protein